MLFRISAVSLCLVALMCLGCFGLSFGESSGQTRHTHTHHYKAPTLAQELVELKQVKEQGVIGDNEYALARNTLINNYSARMKALAMTAEGGNEIEQISHEKTTDRSDATFKLVSPLSTTKMINEDDEGTP